MGSESVAVIQSLRDQLKIATNTVKLYADPATYKDSPRGHDAGGYARQILEQLNAGEEDAARSQDGRDAEPSGAADAYSDSPASPGTEFFDAVQLAVSEAVSPGENAIVDALLILAGAPVCEARK